MIPSQEEWEPVNFGDCPELGVQMFKENMPGAIVTGDEADHTQL